VPLRDLQPEDFDRYSECGRDPLMALTLLGGQAVSRTLRFSEPVAALPRLKNQEIGWLHTVSSHEIAQDRLLTLVEYLGEDRTLSLMVGVEVLLQERVRAITMVEMDGQEPLGKMAIRLRVRQTQIVCVEERWIVM
jgi:hypothetical protein